MLEHPLPTPLVYENQLWVGFSSMIILSMRRKPCACNGRILHAMAEPTLSPRRDRSFIFCPCNYSLWRLPSRAPPPSFFRPGNGRGRQRPRSCIYLCFPFVFSFFAPPISPVLYLRDKEQKKEGRGYYSQAGRDVFTRGLNSCTRMRRGGYKGYMYGYTDYYVY